MATPAPPAPHDAAQTSDAKADDPNRTRPRSSSVANAAPKKPAFPSAKKAFVVAGMPSAKKSTAPQQDSDGKALAPIKKKKPTRLPALDLGPLDVPVKVRLPPIMSKKLGDSSDPDSRTRRTGENLSVASGGKTVGSKNLSDIPGSQADPTNQIHNDMYDYQEENSVREGSVDQEPYGHEKDILTSANIKLENDIDECIISVTSPSVTEKKQVLLGRSFYIFPGRHPLRKNAYRLLSHRYFEKAITIAIFTNFLFLLVTSSFPPGNEMIDDIALQFDKVVFSIFFFEAVIKSLSFGFVLGKTSYLSNPWNLLEFFILIISSLSLFSSLGSYSALRVFRILKPLGETEIFEEIRNIVESLLKSMRALSGLVVLLSVVSILFSVFAIEVFGNVFEYRCVDINSGVIESFDFSCGSGQFARKCSPGFQCQQVDERPDFGYLGFKNIGQSTLTILRIATLDDWSTIMYQTADRRSMFSVAYFVILLICTSFFLVHLALAIVLQYYEAEKRKGKFRRALRFIQTLKEKKTPWIKKHWGYLVYLFVSNGLCDMVEFPLIIGNTVLLVLDAPKLTGITEIIIETYELWLAGLFLVLVIAKFLAYGPLAFIKNQECVFDLLVTSATISEILVFYGFGLSPIRVFRLLSSIRLVKIVLRLKSFALLSLVMSKSLKKLLSLVVVLLTFLAFFAILGVRLFGHSYQTVHYRLDFTTFPKSLLAVFQVFIGEGWAEMAYYVMHKETEFAFLFFIPIMVLGRYMFFYMVLSLIIDTYADASDEIKITKIYKQKQKEALELYASVFQSKTNRDRSMNSIAASVYGNTPNTMEVAETFDKSHTGRADFYEKGKSELDHHQPIPLEAIKEHERDATMPDVIPEENSDFGSQKSVVQPRVVESSKPNYFELIRGSLGRKMNSWAVLRKSLPNIRSMHNSVSPEIVTQQKAQSSEELVKSPTQETVSPLPENGKSAVQSSFPDVSDVPSLSTVESDLSTHPRLHGKSFFIFHHRGVIRQHIDTVIQSPYFETFMVLVIFCSCISLVVDTEKDTIPGKVQTIIDTVCFAFFIAEALLKMIAYGVILGKSSYFRNSWNLFDLFLIFVYSTTIVSSRGSTPFLRVIRSFRAFRPMRLFTKIPLMKAIISSVMGAIPSICLAVLSLAPIFFPFVVFGVGLFYNKLHYCNEFIASGKDVCYGISLQDDGILVERSWNNYGFNFDTLVNSISTLFFLLCRDGWVTVMYRGIDSVEEDVQPIVNYRPHVSIFHGVFLIVGYYFMRSLVIGIILHNFRQKVEQRDFLSLSPEQRQWVNIQKLISGSKPISVFVVERGIFRQSAFDITRNRWFEVFFFACIFLSIVSMMVEKYFLENETARLVFGLMDIFFAALFLVEFCFKIISDGHTYFLQTSNVVDFLVMAVPILEIIYSIIEPSALRGASVARVVRLFRIVRVARLLNISNDFQMIMSTMMLSLRHLLNGVLFIFSILFIFTVIGRELFKGIAFSEGGLDEHSNFSNFGMSMVTLFRIMTYDNWNQVRTGCAIQPPLCSSDESDCGTPWIANIFFVTFSFVMSLLAANIYLAIIFDGFRTVQSEFTGMVTGDDIKRFSQEWAAYSDRKNKYIMKSGRLELLLKSIKAPLGLSKRSESATLFILKLDIREHNGYIHYHEVLYKLSKRLYNFSESELNTNFSLDDLMARSFPSVKHLAHLAPSIAQVRAALIIQQFARRWKKRRMERLLREQQSHPQPPNSVRTPAGLFPHPTTFVDKIPST
eukprot:TRINITY_DN1355_c0_g1_i5.p1 TRINITY_DN1355_c0_g1~~TRINITY_DN1355_c0_g1_i5.p1  ORF type:complete len:1747 (-),score=257.15 TRINITY_DN1355_c0_g1_i5:222-5462(-)